MTPRVQPALEPASPHRAPPRPATVMEDPTGPTGAVRMQLDFDVSYVVPAGRTALTACPGQPSREILRSVTGRLLPGRLTAILGPSGAGKTSFLSILAGQRASGVSGRVLVNGVDCSACADSHRQRRHCVLIAQDMALLGALTAKETLRIAADLKMDSSKHTAQDRIAMVNNIAGILGLEACLDTAVNNLSGGEKKRLSIGVELVTNPPIMFFDEPTSGLDSLSSVQVVSHLRSLALAGRTVAVVLHQPSSRLFQLFDDVLVLGTLGIPGAPGRSLYCGPADRAAAVFKDAGFVCPTFYNIADYVIEVASGEHGRNVESLGLHLEQADEASETEPMLNIVDGIKEDVILEMDMPSPTSLPQGLRSPLYPTSFWVQFAVLLRRSLLVSWRDMNMAWLRFVAHLLVAVILGCMYKDVGNEASKMTGNVACLFFFVLFLFFSNAMPTVLTFPLEAAVFFREHSNNWYSLSAYYLSKILADLPFMVVNPTVFLLVAYYLTDQPTDEYRRCMVWLMCLLTVLLAHAYGLVFGAAFGMQLGIFLVPATTIPLVLFSGFFLYIPDIPIVLRWLSYVSNFRYGFEGTVISVYGMNRKPLNCSLPYCHWKRPSKFLEDIGMLDSDIRMDVIGLAVWIIILHVILVITLKLKVILHRR